MCNPISMQLHGVVSVSYSVYMYMYELYNPPSPTLVHHDQDTFPYYADKTKPPQSTGLSEATKATICSLILEGETLTQQPNGNSAKAAVYSSFSTEKWFPETFAYKLQIARFLQTWEHIFLKIQI